MSGSTCDIAKGDKWVELMKQTKLIIWDDASHIHNHCFEAVHETLQDILEGTISNAN